MSLRSLTPSRLLVAVPFGVWLLFAVNAVTGPRFEGLVNGPAYLVLAGVAPVAVWVRVARVRDERLAWSLAATGLSCWWLGDAIWTFVLPASTEVEPSYVSALYAAPFVFTSAALLLLLLHGPRRTQAVHGALLDGLITALAVAAAVATVSAGPIIDAAGHESRQLLLGLSHVTGDVVIGCLVVVGYGLAGWRPTRTWIVLSIGLLAWAAGDFIFLFVSARDAYVEGGVVDALLLFSGLVSGYAAWQRDGLVSARPATGRAAAIVPFAAGVVALAVAGTGLFASIHPVAALLALASLALLVLRVAIVFAETHQRAGQNAAEARTDVLTGMGNRRALLDDLEVALDTARPRPAVVLLFDLDGFKAYNDEFGHPAGDALLIRLGARLTALRPEGRAYRLGGDEFCLVVPGDHATGAVVARDALDALDEHGDGFRVTASVGSVLLPSEAATVSDALSVADRRMYAAKGDTSSPGRQSRDVLMRILAEREPELHDHVSDVSELVRRTARELGMDAEELDEVARAAELHDVGKVGIPDPILHKPGPLDDEEWAFMRRHTLIGERILDAAPALRPVARIVRSSHERWDGAGYPDGLAGPEIPLGARVILACDAYDAMTTTRPYRNAMPSERARAELRDHTGSQFDPEVVRALERVLDAALVS